MACCGPSKQIDNINVLLKKIRKNEENISLKLDNLKLEFSPNNPIWKSK